MYGLQWVGAVMLFLLRSECLTLQWWFPSQAVVYGLIYGRYHLQPNFRLIELAAELEAHLHLSTSGLTSACRVLEAYPFGKMSSQEHRHYSSRNRCLKFLKNETRESQSWRRILSEEHLPLKSWKNVSF